MKKNNLERTQKAFSNQPSPINFVANNSVCVFPWVIRKGYKNISENGFLDNDVKPDNFSFFQKIFTGKEVIIATWEDSTKLIKPKGENKYYYDFKVGKYYTGQIIPGSVSAGIEIENVEGIDDFLGMKQNGSITLRFAFEPTNRISESEPSALDLDTKPFLPSESDLYNLYTIPEITGNKWLIIENVEYLTDLSNSKFCEVEITFTLLSSKLQTSGRAQEQYVMYGAIGEPYVKPKLEYSVGTDEQRKVIDIEKIENNGVRYIQVELQGTAALSSINITGRKLEHDENGTWFDTWKFLLPSAFVSAQPNDLNRTSIPSKNYYFFPDEEISYSFNYDWIEQWKKYNDAVATNNNTGIFTMGAPRDWDTSPNAGQTDKALRAGINLSNYIPNKLPSRYDYYNAIWYPLSYCTSFGISEFKHNTTGNVYCADNVSYECATDTPLNLLAKNSFINLSYLDLPLSMNSSKPYRTSNIPLIGGLVSMWGGDRIVSSNSIQNQAEHIGYFMDCDIAGMLANLKPTQDGNITGRVESFLGALGGDNVPKWLGADCCNTTFCFELTDKFKQDGNDTLWDTKLLGQTKNPDLTYIFDSKKPLLFSGNKLIIERNTEDNFVIDNIMVQGLFAGKIKISAFGGTTNFKEPIWSTTLISNAEWTKSHRNWTTEIACGGWDDSFCEREDEFTWPETPQKSVGTSISVSMNSNFVLKQSYKQGSAPSFDIQGVEGFELTMGGTELRRIGATHTTYNFRYNEIDNTTSTKEEFLSKYNKIAFSIKGSVDLLGEMDLWGDWDTPYKNNNYNYVKEFDLATWNYMLRPFGFHAQADNENWADQHLFFYAVFATANAYILVNSGDVEYCSYLQQENIDIVLNDDKITITLKPNEHFYLQSRKTINKINNQSSGTLIPTQTNSTITSRFSIDTISFSKK